MDSKPKKKSKQKSYKSKPKLTSSDKHGENYLPLASPFISRASSPVEFDQNHYIDAHISTLDHQKPGSRLTGRPADLISNQNFVGTLNNRHQESNARGILTDAQYNPNLPPAPADTRASREFGPGYKSQSAKSSPTRKDINDFLKSNARQAKPSSRTKNRKQAPAKTFADALQYYDRERRPSAPSRLHITRPSWDLVLRNPLLSAAHSGGDVDAAVQQPVMNKRHLSSGLLGPPHILDINAPEPLLRPVAKNPELSMEWMHTRAKVDFNRPPSQMSIGGNGFGEGYGFPYPENGGEDVFFSSSSEGEDNGGYKYDGDSEYECDNEEAAADDNGLQRKGVQKKQCLTVSPLLSIRRSRRISELNLDDFEADMPNFGEDIWCISTPAIKNAVVPTADKNHPLGFKTGYQTDTDVIKAKTVALTRVPSLPALGRQVINSSSSIGLGSGPAIPNSTRKNVVASNCMREDEADGVGEDELEEEDKGEEIDMDLTGDAVETKIKSGLVLDNEAESSYAGIGERDDTPWITDSIISPPTGYLQRKIGKGTHGADDVDFTGEVTVDKSNAEAPSPHQAPRLDSPFSLSDAGEESGSSSSADTVRARQETHSLLQNPSQDKDVSQTTEEPILTLGNTKRTRSGTIVPAGGAPVLANARRTRSGTIVGPLPAAPTGPLPSIPGPKRTRSGTIVASAPTSGLGRSSPPPSGGGRARSGSVLRFNENNLPSLVAPSQYANENQLDVNDFYTEDPDLEYHTDCLYMPKLTSSPDPIDFLRCASIEEGNEEEDLEPMGFAEPEEIVKDFAWRVVDEPPSPQITKKQAQSSSKLFKARALCGKNWGLNKRGLFGDKGKKARFLGEDDGQQVDDDADSGDKQAEQENLSDDELLLLPGTTMSLWS